MTKLLLAVWLHIYAAPPVIDVVYPRPAPGDTIPRLDKVDSNFVFGSVQPSDAHVFANGYPLPVWTNGAFFAFLPIDWKSQRYRFIAVHKGDTAQTTVNFTTRLEALAAPAPNIIFPTTVEITGPNMRNDPRGTYYLFPLHGTRAEATGFTKGYWKIPLAPGRTGWMEYRGATEVKSADDRQPMVISKIDVDTAGGWIEVRLPIFDKPLFRITDERQPDCIHLEIFNVISKIDRINYRSQTDFVREIYWEQRDDRTLFLDIRLAGPLWGYDVLWREREFRLAVKPPRLIKRHLQNLKIVVDAGHGGEQDGAIGPRRYKEKDVNLQAALALKRKLENLDAGVVLTRSEDISISLTRRAEIADSAQADLFISLHHNALPDGVNPDADVRGCSVHYYRPQSRDLAEAIQTEMVEGLRLPDEGVYYHDLAVARLTTMPAVLIEAAYIILPEQEMRIAEANWHDDLAECIVKGLKKFLKDRNK